MAKGDKMKSQTQPPVGIRYKAWARKINKECRRRQDSTAKPELDKSIRCGVTAPTKCTECGTPIPRSGYIGGEIADAE